MRYLTTPVRARTGTSNTNLQIKYNTEVPLSVYYSRVKSRAWEFPSFCESCPICEARGCAVSHGFYSRRMVLETWELVKDFPVARYLCRGKGKRRFDAVTFSLLPCAVVPYRLFPLPVMVGIMSYWKLLRHTAEQTLGYIEGEIGRWWRGGVALVLSDRTLSEVRTLFDGAFERLSIEGEFSGIVSDLSGVPRQERTIEFCRRLGDYVGVTTELNGVEALDWDYYSLRRGYFGDAHFLFGTPSQFRS